MQKEILNHYLSFSVYTYPGLYHEKLKKDLPDNIRDLGFLLRKNFVHRTTLEEGNSGTNADLRFGDMTQIPWWRQPEDDILVTAAAILAELYRRDSRGFTLHRHPTDKLILTCRFVAIMMASVLKSKGIPARVRAGHAAYFETGRLGAVSVDHWVTEYWNAAEGRWVTIDVDGSLSLTEIFDPYDVPIGKFDFPANAWLSVRRGDQDPRYFYNAKPARGGMVLLWSLFYDFHCLMNNEIIYTHVPILGAARKFNRLSVAELEKIDMLATLMSSPDQNFDQLKRLWEKEKDFRLLIGGLL